MSDSSAQFRISSEQAAREPLRRTSAFCLLPPAFTLIEMLVVIGIIVILAGLLLPMIMRSYRAGARARIAGDLTAIANALEQYKADFGDYPRLPLDPTTGVPLSNCGFAVLGKALIAPGPANPPTPAPAISSPYQAGTFSLGPHSVAVRDTTVGPGTAPDWVPFSAVDGADGPGSRARRTNPGVDGAFFTSDDVVQGKIQSPYLQDGKFKMRGLAILDTAGTPIMYFPQNSVKVNIAQPNTFYVSSNATSPNLPLVSGGGTAMFNFDHNGLLATQLTTEGGTNYDRALARMQAMMGIRNSSGNTNNLADNGTANGRMTGSPEPAAHTGPYVLWSCGPDGRFGPEEDIIAIRDQLGAVRKAVAGCDDVTNFNVGK
jgi:prepilin-type N-terminal cleavage/methylation domain-containing protein